MLKCTDTWRLQVFSIMPKIPNISVESQMGRSVSVPSDLNIAVRPNLPFHFWQTGSLPYFSSLILCREFGKRNKTWGHYGRFCFLFLFLRESFEARKKRLAAPGSGSQTHKSLSTLTSALAKGIPKQPMTVLFDPRTVTNPLTGPWVAFIVFAVFEDTHRRSIEKHREIEKYVFLR